MGTAWQAAAAGVGGGGGGELGGTPLGHLCYLSVEHSVSAGVETAPSLVS